MPRFGRLALALYATVTLLFLMAPVVVVLVLSFSSARYLSFPPPGFSLQWYLHFLTTAAWTDSALTSLWVGLVVTALSLMLGVPAAIGLVRGDFPGKKAVNALVLSPIVIPGIIVAIGMYYAYARYHLVGNPLALVLGHTALAVPFVVINVATALTGVDPRLEQVARSLGAGPLATFRQVTLPLVQPGIFAGAIFAFSTSFDELLVSLFLSGSTAVTLPRRIWDQIRFDIEPTIAAASSLLILLTFGLMVTAEFLRRRSERLRTATSA
jgi:putative spermidine/putrescine transport system permease protein